MEIIYPRNDNRGKHGNHAKGTNAGRWNRGKIISVDGYIKIRVGKTHPLSDPNGYCYEHKLIAVAAFGMPALNGMVIHHKNGDKSETDQRICKTKRKKHQ